MPIQIRNEEIGDKEKMNWVPIIKAQVLPVTLGPKQTGFRARRARTGF